MTPRPEYELESASAGMLNPSVSEPPYWLQWQPEWV